LLVPSSSPRMLQKSLSSPSDALIYDLEDSVAPGQKDAARESLIEHLNHSGAPPVDKYLVRLNAVNTPYFHKDIDAVLRNTSVQSLVLPKINSAEDLSTVSRAIPSGSHVNIIASIESAKSLWNVGEIASWGADNARVIALLFAAEDYCADASIIRTPSRTELLYTRSRIVAAAKAFGLQAIDMVCVNYKDQEYLRDECEEGRRLGYDGKQAIHPDQVNTIQSTFVPTAKEITRAIRVLEQMERAHGSEARGAFGLDLDDGKGGAEMIDEPMVKQARKTIQKARAAGIDVPEHW
ncbi:hypothetical protein BOTBODRAFT_106648, partial [Botryobasidium botryosum FD-172 SS1]